MSVTKKDCIRMLHESGMSELDATQTVESLLASKASLAAAGKLERGAADPRRYGAGHAPDWR